MTAVRRLHGLAMLAWGLGVLGLLIHLAQWQAAPVPMEPLIATVHASLAALHEGALDKAPRVASAQVLEHPDVWVSWWHSPLNLQVWVLAGCYLFPAFVLSLATHHVAWCRRHLHGSPPNP